MTLLLSVSSLVYLYGTSTRSQSVSDSDNPKEKEGEKKEIFESALRSQIQTRKDADRALPSLALVYQHEEQCSTKKQSENRISKRQKPRERKRKKSPRRVADAVVVPSSLAGATRSYTCTANTNSMLQVGSEYLLVPGPDLLLACRKKREKKEIPTVAPRVYQSKPYPLSFRVKRVSRIH